MLVKNLSTRQLILRDSDDNQYVIPSLGDTVLDDALLDDNTFRRYLRWRLRDIIISPFISVQKNGVPVDSQPTLNFEEGTNVTFDITSVGNKIDLAASAAADVDWSALTSKPTNFPIEVRKADVSVGSRSNLNFHAGANITLTITDDGVNDEVDITIDGGTVTVDWGDLTNVPTSFTPSAHQVTHASGGTDIITGNLDAIARLSIAKAGSVAGARRKVNFIEGSNITLALSDDNANEKVDVTISAANLASNSATFLTLVAESGLSNSKKLADIINKGLIGSRPATSNSGILYYVTDSGSERLTRDKATGWDDLLLNWSYLTGIPSSFTPSSHASTHQSGQADALSGNLDATARTGVAKNSAAVTGTRRQVNFIEGTNIGITIADDSVNERVNITISSSAPGVASNDASYLTYNAEPGLTHEKVLGTDVIGKGTLANQPVAGLAGALYYITNSGSQRITRDSGSAWEDLLYHWNYLVGIPSTFTPSAHATTHQPGGSDVMAVDAAAGTGSLRTLGTSSTQAAAGNDSRFTNSRTPTAHETTHLTGGTDALAGTIDATARVGVAKNSAAATGTRRQVNFIEGASIALTVADDNNNERVSITIDLSLTDVATGNVTSTAHGFAPKSPADSTKFLNGAATPAYAQPKDSDLATTDVTTNNVVSTKHGFAPKSPADATQFLNGAATPAYAAVKDSDLATTDVTTNNSSSTKHGFSPKSPADATKFLNGATTPAYAQVKDSDLATTDITTNDVSITKHGFAPKVPNDATKYLDGTGLYSVPPSGTTSVGTSFPGSPADGAEYIYVVDATNGIYWHFKYRTATTKWIFIGGASLMGTGGSAGSIDTLWHAAGPTLTVPLTGTYVVEIGANCSPYPNSGTTAQYGFFIGAAGSPNFVCGTSAPGGSMSCAAINGPVSITAATSVTGKFQETDSNDGAWTSSCSNGYIKITPNQIS